MHPHTHTAACTLLHALLAPSQAKRGGLKDTDAVDLLATVFKAVLDRTRLNPADIGDIVVGSVLGPSSQRANEARIASFFAGIPEEVPVRTVNRWVWGVGRWWVMVVVVVAVGLHSQQVWADKREVEGAGMVLGAGSASRCMTVRIGRGQSVLTATRSVSVPTDAFVVGTAEPLPCFA